MAVHNSDIGVKNLDGAIELGKQTLKSLELVNGGAVVAILTFYGNLSTGKSTVSIDRYQLTIALGAFAIGLACAVAAACCAYIGQLTVATSEPDFEAVSQQQINTHRNRQVGKSVLWIYRAMRISAVSLLLFLIGTGFSISAMLMTSRY